jgi:creatinine amidohydrolase
MPRRLTNLGDTCWTDLTGIAAGTVLLVPLGSTEQHGPHLPLSTDTSIAVALATRVAEGRSDVLVAPALPYGSSGEHAGFTGTLSIGQDALEHVVVELVRSADAFAGVVLVSGHGGNAEALERAVSTLQAEGRRVMAWTPHGYADAHAGRSETSILLELGDARVRLDRAEAGATEPISELMGPMRAGGVRAVSPNGVLGDPSGARALEGRALLGMMTAELVAFVEAVRGG